MKEIAGRVGGWAMVAFARLNPDTPGKLTAHAFSYEHMEFAAYELLARVAQRAGDQSAEVGQRLGAGRSSSSWVSGAGSSGERG